MFGIKIGDSSFPAENGQYLTPQCSMSYAIYRHLCYGFLFESGRHTFRNRCLALARRVAIRPDNYAAQHALTGNAGGHGPTLRM